MFKPRNPWTMSILNCLAEIHQVDDLKLTLKFEVEVLCNTLKINIHVNKILLFSYKRLIIDSSLCFLRN